MHYLFVYHGGVVPEDQAEQNISDLWNWLDNLKARGYEKVRFAGFGRKTVSPHAVEDYQGDIFWGVGDGSGIFGRSGLTHDRLARAAIRRED